MTWSTVDSLPISLNWEYTDPVQGDYFRIRHTGFPTSGSCSIAQAELKDDGTLELFGCQELKPHPEAETFILKKPGTFKNRRIAFKRIPTPINFESELRRVFRNALLEPDAQLIAPRRSSWQVEIEVSDYVEPVTSSSISGTGSTSSGTAATDPSFANVVLLMHFDGTNNAVAFNDVKNHPFTVNGTPKISTAQSKFGGASAYFDGAGTISTPDSDDWNFAAGDFTIEAWVYRTGLDQYVSAIVSHWNTGSAGDNAWSFVCEANTAYLAFGITTNGTTSTDAGVSSGVTVPANQWCHVAVSRQSGVLRFFINGVQAGQNTTRNQTIFNSSRPLTVGGISSSSSSGAEWHGYIDDLRITKGVARYTSNFTVPNQAFANS